MRTYHVYSDGPDGLAVIRAIDDIFAVEVATRGRHTARILEVWERERLVLRLPHRAAASTPAPYANRSFLANQGFRADI